MRRALWLALWLAAASQSAHAQSSLSGHSLPVPPPAAGGGSGTTTIVQGSGPITVGGTAAAPVLSLGFPTGVTAPSVLPKVVATGSYGDLLNPPSLLGIGVGPGSARDAAAAIAAETAASQAAQTASSAVASETSRATAAEVSAAQKANNLGDLPSPATARANLGLGTAATAQSTAFTPSSITPTGATSARTLSSKAGDALSLLDFGAACNGTTDDTAAINAAMASGKRIGIPSGLVCYGASIGQGSITGLFVGPGQIKTSDGNLRGPTVAQVSAAPASTASPNVVQGFNGDLTHVPMAVEHRVTGASLPLPSAGAAGAPVYLFENEIAAQIYSDYFASGGNASAGALLNAQRTGYATHVSDLTHAGQGDAATHLSSVFVQGPNPGALPMSGQTSFLQGPAGSSLVASITAGAPGVYLQGIGDIDLNDEGYDVAGIGSVVNLNRANNTGSLGNTWIGHRVQSNGATPSDAAFSAAGKYRMVLDAVDTVPGGTGAVVAAGAGQRYYGNASQLSAQAFPSTVGLGTEYFDYSSTSGWEFVVGGNSLFHVSSSGVTAPTPTSGDSTTKVATTGFVTPAIATETGRAMNVEGNLVPKIAIPSATANQLYAGTGAAGALAPVSLGANLSISPGATPALTVTGVLAQDAAQSVTSQRAGPVGALQFRTFAQILLSDFDPRDFGAPGNSTSTAIGQTYGTTLASMASYTNPLGAQPLSWMTNPVFGLTFTMTVTACPTGSANSGTNLCFGYAFVQNTNLTLSAFIAPWQDPSTRNFLIRPNMQVTNGPGTNCIPANTTLAGWTTTTVRQGELYPGPPPNSPARASGTVYDAGSVFLVGSNAYKVTIGGTSAASQPAAEGGPSNGLTGIADGSMTVAYVPPAAVDYSNGLAVPVGSLLFANGNEYQATTGGTTSSSGTGPSGSGTGITDGSATFAFFLPGESVALPNGNIALSQAASGCSVGSQVTLTVSPADLQGRTQDWLGLQTALAQAWLANNNFGARVHIRSGVYLPNAPLVVAAGNFNTPRGDYGIEVYGDGQNNTQLLLPAGTDLQQDEALIMEGAQGKVNGQPVTSLATYADFRVGYQGSFTAVNGVSPHQGDGISAGKDAIFHAISASGFKDGIVLAQDHQQIDQGSNLAGNGCGVKMAAYPIEIGNQKIEDTALASNYIAGVCVDETNSLDAGYIKNSHTGFEPYGFYKLPNRPNVTTGLPGLVTDTTFDAVPVESAGYAWMYGSSNLSLVGDNIYLGAPGSPSIGGNTITQLPDGLGSYYIGTSSVLPAPALIYAATWNNNSLFQADWAVYPTFSSPTQAHQTYGVSTAVIVTFANVGGQSACSSNVFRDVNGIVYQAQYAVQAFSCPNGPQQDTFDGPNIKGFWAQDFAGAGRGDVQAGSPVSTLQTVQGDIPYEEGQVFLGNSVTRVKAGGVISVVTEGRKVPMLMANPGENIPLNVGMFPTRYPNVGYELALDPTDSVATNYGYSANSGGIFYGDLSPTMRGGQAAPATGLTAGVSPNCTQMGQVFSTLTNLLEFASAPPGACVQLGVMPMGKAITIINDDPTSGHTLSILPPSGYNFQGQGANAAATTQVPATGGIGVYRRIGPTTVHQ